MVRLGANERDIVYGTEKESIAANFAKELVLMEKKKHSCTLPQSGIKKSFVVELS